MAHWSGGTATASSAIQQIKLIAYLSTRHIEQRTSDIERQQINRAPSSQPIDGGASFVRHFHSSSSSSIVSAIFSLLPHMINSLSSARDRCLIIVCNKIKKKPRAQANRSSRCHNWPKPISRFLAGQLANHDEPANKKKMEKIDKSVCWRVAERSSSSAPSAHHRSTYARRHGDPPAGINQLLPLTHLSGAFFDFVLVTSKFKVDRRRTLDRLGSGPTATDSSRPPEVRIAAEPAANKRGRIIDPPLGPHVPRCNSLAFDFTWCASVCEN